MAEKMLMRFARAVVNMVSGQLTQQGKFVEQEAVQPMNKMISQVQGGAWGGDGADQFLDEVRTKHIPLAMRIIELIGGSTKKLAQATEIMDRADKESHKMSQNLISSKFETIYRR